MVFTWLVFEKTSRISGWLCNLFSIAARSDYEEHSKKTGMLPKTGMLSDKHNIGGFLK